MAKKKKNVGKKKVVVKKKESKQLPDTMILDALNRIADLEEVLKKILSCPCHRPSRLKRRVQVRHIDGSHTTEETFD